MMKSRGDAERPTKDRKGARKMAPVRAISREESTIPLHKFGSKVSFRLVAKKKKDTSLLGASSKFDRRLIQKCRKDGMTDGEIQKWMQEI